MVWYNLNIASDDGFERAQFLTGAEGERKNSQAKGPNRDDTL